MSYAAEWDLDDPVLDREEVEAVVQHVAAFAQVAGEVTRGRRGLSCTFRVPVSATADVVTALDPQGLLLGDEWWRDLDPPMDGDDGYVVRLELLGPVDGGLVDDEDGVWDDLSRRARAANLSDDEPAEAADDDDDEDRDDDDDDDDTDVDAFELAPRARADQERASGGNGDGDGDGDDVVRRDVSRAGRRERSGCVARLRIEALDNREAWPVAFVLASAIVDRLGGDLREDLDDELFELQRNLPKVAGPAVDASGGVTVAPYPLPRDDADEDELLN